MGIDPKPIDVLIFFVKGELRDVFDLDVCKRLANGRASVPAFSFGACALRKGETWRVVLFFPAPFT